MTDFLLELRSEEIPARMQAKARDDLARLFAAELAKSGLAAAETQTYTTPRRLALIARGLPDATQATAEETKGPKTTAPPQALDGFLRKTGLTRDQLIERDGVLYAVTEKPGRATVDVLAEAIPAIVRAFPWPKSMRWGAASTSTESLRWVRPLQGIVALFGADIVPCAIAGVTSGAATLGHRFHHPGVITIGDAHDYVEKLRACHVVVDHAERESIIALGATMAAAKAGLTLVRDEGLLIENAGLTEWPMPLLGRFDAAFLDVPPEVIQLTARVNQKYFVCTSPLPLAGGAGGGNAAGDRLEDDPTPNPSRKREGSLANAFVCTANIDATDGGATIVEGNRKVLAARLSDARFFYETDLKTRLEDHAKKLDRIVFHEKLGTVADKVARVAKLARWLVEEGIVSSAPLSLAGGAGGGQDASSSPSPADIPTPNPSREREGNLADLVERAARLCKADLVTGMVGEFPELQGVIGGYYAAAQGEHPAVAAAISDHYKPVGQGDEVPTDPVTVAVSLADKLDTVVSFFAANLPPTGSKDPFALRRAALGVAATISTVKLRGSLPRILETAYSALIWQRQLHLIERHGSRLSSFRSRHFLQELFRGTSVIARFKDTNNYRYEVDGEIVLASHGSKGAALEGYSDVIDTVSSTRLFLIDRLKVQQREAGVRHDLIDAVFAAKNPDGAGEDDLVRLLARVHALQAFIGTADGANLLAGYKRAANILKKEGYGSKDAPPVPLPAFREGLGVGAERSEAPSSAETGPTEEEPTPGPSRKAGRGEKSLSYTPEISEAALIAALDSAEPAAAQAVAAEDFAAAMAALATLRVAVDAFFETVTVNDADPVKRAARLALLARVRAAVHNVADFSKIEG